MGASLYAKQGILMGSLQQSREAGHLTILTSERQGTLRPRGFMHWAKATQPVRGEVTLTPSLSEPWVAVGRGRSQALLTCISLLWARHLLL